MALRMYGLQQALELFTASADDEEGLSEDEMLVGDFVTDGGQSVVLSGEALSRMSEVCLTCQTWTHCYLTMMLVEMVAMAAMVMERTVSHWMSEPEHEDSNSDSEDTFVYDWCEAEPNSISPEFPEFQEQTCPSDEAKNAKTPFECFQLFFTTVLVTILTTQTNMYADQLRTATAPSPSNRWHVVSIEEMLAYLGMHIAMGIVNMPSLRDFWSSNPIMQHQWFPSIMSRDRFKQILRYFHCADSNNYIPRGEEGHDPLYKVRELIDILTDRFKLCYSPGRELSIDERKVVVVRRWWRSQKSSMTIIVS